MKKRNSLEELLIRQGENAIICVCISYVFCNQNDEQVLQRQYACVIESIFFKKNINLHFSKNMMTINHDEMSIRDKRMNERKRKRTNERKRKRKNERKEEKKLRTNKRTNESISFTHR